MLDRIAASHLRRPSGRPPKEGYETVIELGSYQAESWQYPQRLLLVVIDFPVSITRQLFVEPDYFFLLTNWDEKEKDGAACPAHYRSRGTFEDRLSEFNQALGTQLSSPEFRENEATFLLCLLAFNLSNMLRGELESSLGGCWDLTRFRNYVLKSGARVTKHSRRLLVYLAQAVTGFWERLAARIRAWRLADRFPAPHGPTRRPWQEPPRHAFVVEVVPT